MSKELTPLELTALAPRFTIREYSNFGLIPQDQTRILFESDNLQAVKEFIKEYFKYEDYFNAVYFIDNKLNKSGYVGRNLTINCGENLFAFCELQDSDNKFNKEDAEMGKELEALAKLYEGCSFEETINSVSFEKEYKIIETALKALEIIKDIITIDSRDIDNNRICVIINGTSKIQKEEFDLLKEVLK